MPGKKYDQAANGGIELTIPNHFRCPISLDLMKDPVTLSTGITYDRESIETWIEAGNCTCPITNQVLRNFEPIPNHAIRKMIQDWCVEKQSYGIERIPTPRIPVNSFEVSGMLSKVMAAQQDEDGDGCREVVAKIKALVKESDRNRRCIVGNETGCVLSATFEAFAKRSFDENVAVLEEILSALTLMFPLDLEAKSQLGSTVSLNCMVWFLKCGGLSGRRNAVLVLKEVLSSDQQKVDALGEIEGAMEALVKLITEPICPTTTKASLMAIYYMVSSSSLENEKVVARFAEMGLVSLMLEMLVESERSICEKALGVLDGLCGCEEGRQKAYEHALTMPVLVKKILRVSDFATEFSVSILWKLSKNEKREGGNGSPNPASKLWKRQDQLILSWIVASVSEGVLPQLVGTPTTSAAWNTLVSAYASGLKAHIRELRAQLHHLHHDIASIETYVVRAKGIANKLATLQHLVSDEELIEFVVVGLGPAYKLFTRMLDCRTDDFDFDDLYGMLLTEECRLTREDAVAIIPPSVQFSQFSSPPFNRGRGRWRGGRGRRRTSPPFSSPSHGRGYQPSNGSSSATTDAFPIVCHNCNSNGHLARVCPSPKMNNSFRAPTKPSSNLASTSSQTNQTWLLDSGTTHHLTADLDSLAIHSEYTGPE
ncbi:hypothetical protein F0562_032467 [Nyssa sinensis]|uniref:U-box domain-containing protein n=1 Tax=Nyssa sinensis TaxID=561372 RepID=A0A5J5AQ42_9ASTE|nr:hypothetical protein F0562_032467 [Nyssa sinensis]